MRKNQGTKKLAKPIKKTIQKATTITHKSNATTIKVKPRTKAEKLEGNRSRDGDARDSTSVPRTLPSSFLEKWPILTSDFYQIDALDLAPRLLGKYLRRDDVVLQITEVEAYRPNDSACHGRFGITARTAPVRRLSAKQSSKKKNMLSSGRSLKMLYLPSWLHNFRWNFNNKNRLRTMLPLPDIKKNMGDPFVVHATLLLWRCTYTWSGCRKGKVQKFGPGGHAYIYLCYGLHTMLNIVADKEGIGAAVLIRSCAPISGLETIQQRRGIITEKPILLTGPGKVGQALGISTEWSHHSLFTPGGLELLDGPEPENILVGPRVGIDYALPEHVTALWRFAIAGTPWISAPKSTLTPR